MASENTERILTVLSQIPPGRVATYGQIAKLAGLARNARQFGVILAKLQDPGIPWYRVVNSRGEISCRGSAKNESIQKAALQEENVEFDSQGRILISEFGWHPDSPSKSKYGETSPLFSRGSWHSLSPAALLEALVSRPATNRLIGSGGGSDG